MGQIQERWELPGAPLPLTLRVLALAARPDSSRTHTRVFAQSSAREGAAVRSQMSPSARCGADADGF